MTPAIAIAAANEPHDPLISAGAQQVLTKPVSDQDGSFCIADSKVRPWGEREVQLLQELASIARAELGARLPAGEAPTLAARGVGAVVRVLARHGAAIADADREALAALAERQLARLSRS